MSCCLVTGSFSSWGAWEDLARWRFGQKLSHGSKLLLVSAWVDCAISYCSYLVFVSLYCWRGRLGYMSLDTRFLVLQRQSSSLFIVTLTTTRHGSTCKMRFRLKIFWLWKLQLFLMFFQSFPQFTELLSQFRDFQDRSVAKTWASKLQEESGQGRGKNSEGTRTKCTKWMSRCTRTYPAFLYWDSNFFCFLRHLNLSILSILTICVLTTWLVFVASLKEEDTLNRFEGGALKSEQVWRLWHGTGGRHPQLFAEGVDPWKDFWKLMLRVWYSYSFVLFHSWLYSVIICHYMVIICHQTVIIYHSFSFYLRVYSHSFLSVLIVFRSKLQLSEWSWISVRSWSSPALFGAGSAMSRCW